MADTPEETGVNVLINCLSLDTTGADIFLRNAVGPLSLLFDASSGKHKLFILANERQTPLFLPLPCGSAVVIRKKRRTALFRFLWEFMFLAGTLRRNRIDVLLTPYQVAMTRQRRVKHVLMLRNMEPFCFDRYPYGRYNRFRNRVLRSLGRSSLRQADRVIAISRYVAGYAKEKIGVRPERIVTFYHGRDEAFSHRGDRVAGRAELAKQGVKGDFIFTCGSLLPYRRCEDVIAGFAGFRKGYNQPQPCSLVIAGSGNDWKYMEKLINAIKNSGCAGDIIMAGHVPHDMIVLLYRYCRACVIASEVEACPNIAIEAMTSGCAIVSCDSAPLPEMFAGCSLEYKSRDTEGLARALGRIHGDEALRQALSYKALVRSGDFTWQKCAEETYRTLVEW